MRKLYGTGTARGLVASLEEDLAVANGEEGGNIPAADVLGIDTSIQMEEVNEAAQSFESLEEDMAEANAAAVQLEDTVLPLAEGAAEDGGLDRPAAAAVAVAAEAICLRAGIAAGRINMPSAESFGGRSSRVGQTKLAIEGIKESLKTIWEAIIAGLKKAWSWVKDQYNKFFGTAEMLKKRAEAIEKKAANTTGTTMKEKTFDDGALFKKLHIAGAVENATVGAELIKKTAGSTLQELSDSVISKADKMSSELEDPMKANFVLAPGGIGGFTEVAAGRGYDNAGNGLKWISTAEIPGGKTVLGKMVTAQLSGAEALEAMGKMKFTIAAYSTKASEPSKDTMKTLSTSDCETVAKNIKDAATDLVNFRKKKDEAEKVLEKIIKSAQKVADSAVKDDEKKEDEKKMYKAVQSYLSTISGVLIGGPASSFQYCLSTGKAYLDYADKSLAQYESK